MAKVSNCCGASTIHWEYGLCPRCKEHCEFIDEEEDDDMDLPHVQSKSLDDLFTRLGVLDPKKTLEQLNEITTKKKP